MGRFTVITGTGSYIPERVVSNSDFLDREFYDETGQRYPETTEQSIRKCEKITGIQQRRYVLDSQVASDIAHLAAEDALKSSGTDKESLDRIILSHNFGDSRHDRRQSDTVPSLAARVKHKLGIENPKTIAYDLIFGCPGWLQGMMLADTYIKAGEAKRIMVIGAETLSRVADPHDRNSMIFADGAGATIVEAAESETPVGIISKAARTDSKEQAYLLYMGRSHNPDYKGDGLFLRMHGHEIYKYAIRIVPQVVKESLDKAGLTIKDVKKLLLHQANAKMDEKIVSETYNLYGIPEPVIPANATPMTISWLGNSSVATLPTLLDLMRKGKMNGHGLESGDVVVFASVGAGMNINSVVYRNP
jgi:3-oxoacyl-[acyl-carrier-protein] synthase-3